MSAEIAAARLPGDGERSVRGRRVLRGTGMVRPLRTFSVGAGDVLDPAVSRLAADHPLVISRPSAFTPCDKDDRASHETLLRHIERALAEARGGGRVVTRHAGRKDYLVPVNARPARPRYWLG